MSRVLIFAVEVDDTDEVYVGEPFDVINNEHTFLDARLAAIINPDEANHDLTKLVKEVL